MQSWNPLIRESECDTTWRDCQKKTLPIISSAGSSGLAAPLLCSTMMPWEPYMSTHTASQDWSVISVKKHWPMPCSAIKKRWMQTWSWKLKPPVTYLENNSIRWNGVMISWGGNLTRDSRMWVALNKMRQGEAVNAASPIFIQVIPPMPFKTHLRWAKRIVPFKTGQNNPWI